MSKYGIEYAVFGKKNKDGSYVDGRWISPVAGYNGTPNVVSGADYGDNRSLDPESFVSGGTLSVEFNRDQTEIYTMLLGHDISDSGEIKFDANDEAPVVGTGAVGRSDGRYKAVFYTEVQFHEPNDENTTRNNTMQHNHVNLEGDILIPDDGVWKKVKYFNTKAEAVSYLNNLVGITAA